MKESIYFIAIIPPPEICEEVRQFQVYAQTAFETGHALRSPPHITLQAPFRWQKANFKILDQSLNDFIKAYSSFYVELKNFSAFPPRVVFVNIEQNKTLSVLQDNLSLTLKNDLGLVSDRPDRTFHPHMTVAFKDLKKARFDTAWAHFSVLSYQRTFEVKSIFLLKHENKRWEIFEEYSLNRLSGKRK